MAPRRSGRLKHLPGPCGPDATELVDANKKSVTIDCLPDVLLLQVLASTKSNGYVCRYSSNACGDLSPGRGANSVLLQGGAAFGVQKMEGTSARTFSSVGGD